MQITSRYVRRAARLIYGNSDQEHHRAPPRRAVLPREPLTRDVDGALPPVQEGAGEMQGSSDDLTAALNGYKANHGNTRHEMPIVGGMLAAPPGRLPAAAQRWLLEECDYPAARLERFHEAALQPAATVQAPPARSDELLRRSRFSVALGQHQSTSTGGGVGAWEGFSASAAAEMMSLGDDWRAGRARELAGRPAAGACAGDAREPQGHWAGACGEDGLQLCNHRLVCHSAH